MIHKKNIDINWPKPDIHFEQNDVKEETAPSCLFSDWNSISSIISGTIDSLVISEISENIEEKRIITDIKLRIKLWSIPLNKPK